MSGSSGDDCNDFDSDAPRLPSHPRHRVVRAARPRSALAPPRSGRLGCHGERVHAPADPGEPSAPGLRTVDGPVAAPRRPGRRRPGRSRPRLGPARLPAARAAAARGGAGNSGTPRRRRAQRARPVARAARDRGVHGRGRGLVRVRAASRGAGHERPQGVREGRHRYPVPAERDHRGRAQARPRPAPRGGGPRRQLGGCHDGTRRTRVHREGRGLHPLPDRRAVRLAAGREARPPGPATPRPDLRRHRPAGAGPAARGAA